MGLTNATKVRLYEGYVSSGQMRMATTPPSQHYAPRAAYIKHVMRRHFPADRSARILDLGCGDGAWLYFLQLAGYSKLTGVDASTEQVGQAHRLGVEAAQLGSVEEFLHESGTASFDTALLFDVLEHFETGGCIRVLDEVYRVLEPGGRLILHVPNGEGLFGMAVRYGDCTHEHAFTAQSIFQLLATAGFSAIDSFEDRPVVHGLKSAIRRMVWEAGTALPRILSMAETGRGSCVLSRNLLTVARK